MRPERYRRKCGTLQLNKIQADALRYGLRNATKTVTATADLLPLWHLCFVNNIMQAPVKSLLSIRRPHFGKLETAL